MQRLAQSLALAVALAISATIAAAAQASKGAIDHDREYAACLKLVGTKPEEAFESALAWRDSGGGLAAKHCAALALVELKLYADAADRLEKLAEDMQKEGSRLTVEVLAQAGNAWLLASLPNRAETVLSAALKLDPENVDILIDRARALASAENWVAARTDLDKALSLEPERDDAYTFRAAARRHLDDRDGALEDVETALALNPDSPEALLERGILRRYQGDAKGARADWLKVRLNAPNTPAADAAGINLEDLDVRRD